MLARAFIVVLAVLNLGVALWWLSRPADPPPAAAVAQAPAGVASLQLAEPAEAGVVPAEAPQAAVATNEVAPPPAPVPAPAPVAVPPVRCVSLGPFDAQADAQAALARAGSLLEKGVLREEHDDGQASSYRVLLPSVGDRATAQALLKRIADAGIGDYYLMSQGEDSNTIALGQYRSREGAERRRAELAAKGFPAELIANGGSGRSRWWIDARTRAAAAALGAQRLRSLDCAALR